MKDRNEDPRRKEGRERLLATARDLFTRRGASNVGINDVTATAGVAKMTLYNNFPSKDALVLAVYRDMMDTDLRDLSAMARADGSEQERLLGLLDHFDRDTHAGGDRGCPFIHASLQAAESAGPIYQLVRAYKCRLRDHIRDLLDPDRSNREDLADQLLILLDGMVTERYLRGVGSPVDAARRAALTLLRATT